MSEDLNDDCKEDRDCDLKISTRSNTVRFFWFRLNLSSGIFRIFDKTSLLQGWFQASEIFLYQVYEYTIDLIHVKEHEFQQ